MNVDLGIWAKLRQVFLVLILLAALAGAIIVNLPNIRQNEQFRRQILTLENDVQKEEETARNLKSSIDALRNDPRTVERLIRPALTVARTNETIIVFTNPPAPARY